MAERLVEDEQSLRFVHPLVRSAVYQDLAVPVRQRWHQRAARMLDAQGAPQEEVTVHLLAAAAAAQPLLERIQARASRVENLDPRLHANLAIELAATGEDRDSAVRHARRALEQIPGLRSASTAALPETISVLLFADHAAEAREAAGTWLDLAQRQGSAPAGAPAAGLISLLALYGGQLSEAVAFGQQGIAGTPNIWISTITSSFVVRALIERDALADARALLGTLGLDGDLPPTWPHNLVRHARGCLHAAAGDHAAASADLQAAGELAQRWGIPNPAILPWRSAAALSLAALGDGQAARALCADEIRSARRWAAGRALGIALHAAGVVEGRTRGIDLLTEAVTVLRSAPAPLELARALTDLGAAHRRAGARLTAREILREGLDLAHAMGGLAVAARARRELIVAGGRPRRDATRGRDALTSGELRVAQLAAAGHTNRQIAQALFVTQRTVENHLTSTYAKLGIGSRGALAAALADVHTADSTLETLP
jgi:DNA-binding CsgD family transcriptional regulator